MSGLVLEYEKAVDVKEIHVYENHCPGALARVITFGEGKRHRVLWRGEDPWKLENGRNIAKLPVRKGAPIKRIKIYLNSKDIKGWNQIDAVGLLDVNGKMHWAIGVAASSAYGNSPVDPGVFGGLAR